jgi:hypothetical protein
MLDRAKFQGSYDESDEFEWQALSVIELRLVQLYRRMSDEDRKRVRRMAEILTEVPDRTSLDKSCA